MVTTYLPPADTSLFLEDGLVAITAERVGKYAGVDRIYDIGAGPPDWLGFVVIDVTAITAGGGRTYQAIMEVSSSSTFAADVTQYWSVSISATGQVVYPFTNLVATIAKRYVRVRIIPTGTTPSITLKVWLMIESILDDLSQSQLTRTTGAIVAQAENMWRDFRGWMSGTATGGPGSNGLYPLRDLSGASALYPCPAKMAADVAAFVRDPYVMNFNITNVPLLDGEELGQHTVGQSVWLAAAFVDVEYFIRNGPTAAAQALLLKKRAKSGGTITTIGTFNVASGATVFTTGISGAIQLLRGDVVWIEGPTPGNTTFRNWSISLIATRGTMPP